MTKEEEAQENVDPQEEIEFGRTKQKTRAKIIEADQVYNMVDNRVNKRGGGRHGGTEDGASATGLPRVRPSKHESDMESTRSTPPPPALGRSMASGSSRRGAGLKYQMYEGSSPAGPSSQVVEGVVARKPRPPTAHQLAVERNRHQRIEYLLDRGLRKRYRKMQKKRRREGAIIRALKRTQAMEDAFENSEGEEGKYATSDKGKHREKGFGGIVQTVEEEDDFGEEAAAYAASLRRVTRRLERWEQHKGPELGIIAPVKRHRSPAEVDAEDMMRNGDVFVTTPGSKYQESGPAKTNGHANIDVHMEEAEDINEAGKHLCNVETIGDGKGEELEVDQTTMTIADRDTDGD